MKTFRYLCFILTCFFTQNVIAGGIDVMTQNQYAGVELAPLLSAVADLDAFNGDPDAFNEFNEAVIGLLKRLANTKTTERIKALAALITKRQPHLVGLQEVYEFGCINQDSEIDACHDPSISGAFVDHLSETRAALNPDPVNPAYVDVARVDNLKLPPDEFPLPFPFTDGIPFDLNQNGTIDASVTVLDRDVILARSDVSASPVVLCNPNKRSEEGCNYSAALQVSTGLGNFSLNRGYVVADATVKDKEYRFVNTHLETKDPPIPASVQAYQAQELIETLAPDSLPLEGKSLIVVGDMNSAPEDQTNFFPSDVPPPPYQQFTANYTDAWTLRPGDAKGFTCCQQPDLSNRKSELYERIDMIFSQDAPKKVKQARVLGDEVSSKTPPPGRGLWPSDHGSVAIKLRFY